MKLAVLPLFAACACTGMDASSPAGEPTAPPFSEKSDSADSGDRDCRIVLDHVTAPENDNNEPGCDDAFACSWRALVDVREDVAVKDVGLIYTVEGRQDDLWFAITGAEADEPSEREGYRRSVVFFFAFPADDLGEFVVEMIPFYSLEAGGRVFDHNRNDGSHQNYVLNEENGWSIAPDPNACAGE